MGKYSEDFEKNREETIQRFLEGGESVVETINNRLADNYLDDFKPLEINVIGNFEKAFRTFRTLVQKERILSDYKQRQSYEKPSVKKRRKRNEAKQKQMELEARRQKILSGEFEKELVKKRAKKEEKKKNKEENK